MSPITLSDNEAVLSLYAFIFSNQHSRAPHIYGLRIPSPYLYADQVMDRCIFDERLVAILEAAVHIQYLQFPTSVMDPVFDAAMKIPTLRELHAVAEDGLRGLFTRLITLRSPLRSLCIEECDPMGDNISAFTLHKHLAHLAPTLEELDLGFFPLNIRPSSITTQFSAVRSLRFRADYISFDFHPMAILLRLFPNLDDTLVLGSSGTMFTDEELSALRARSEEEQKARGWPRLDRLVCDAEWAIVYAIQCPIRRMDIRMLRLDGKSYLMDTLRTNSPAHLHLTVGRLMSLSVRGVLDGLFPVEAAERLTHLVILIGFKVYSKWRAYLKGKRIPWTRLFKGVVGSVEHLRPTHLRIILDCTVYQGVPEFFPDGHLVNAAYEGKLPDLSCIAARLSDTMPSLKYLFLDARGEIHIAPEGNNRVADEDQAPHTWGLPKAWSFVRRDESDPSGDVDAASSGSWTELTGEAMEKVMEEEELR